MDETRFTPFWRQAILALVLCALLQLQHAYASDFGYVLTQTSPLTSSTSLIFISARGIKTTNAATRTGTIVAGPHWDQVTYNDNTKQYARLPNTAWRSASYQGTLPAGRASRQHSSDPVVRLGVRGQVAGLNAVQYLVEESTTDGLPASLMGKALGCSKSEIWMSADLPIPAPLNGILAWTYGVPNLKGYPLRVTYIDAKGRRIAALDTKAARRTQLSASVFSVPPAYQLVNNQFQPLMDERTKRAFNAVLDELSDQQAAADMRKLLGISDASRPPATAPVVPRPPTGQQGPTAEQDLGNLLRTIREAQGTTQLPDR